VRSAEILLWKAVITGYGTGISRPMYFTIPDSIMLLEDIVKIVIQSLIKIGWPVFILQIEGG